MLKLFFWLRYLRKKRIVILSIFAVAISVALLITVASLFTGFIKAVQSSASKSIGDVVIDPPIRFGDYPEFILRLEELDQVKAATAVIKSNGLLHVGSGNVRAVEVLGIEPAKRAAMFDLKSSLLLSSDSDEDVDFGASQEMSGFVGIGVLLRPDDKTDEYDKQSALQMIGREVVLISGAVSEDRDGKKFNRKNISFTISDIIFTGVYEFDKQLVYLPIDKLQAKLYPDDVGSIASQIQIKLTEGADVDLSMALIRGKWREFAEKELGWSDYFIDGTTIVTSQEMQGRYIEELYKQMTVLLMIFGIVSLSVIFLILCIFYMIVMTRQKDIAILKSCGSSSWSVASIFIGFGGFVGLIGSCLGVFFSYLLTSNINSVEEFIRVMFGFKLWSSSVYIFSTIPNQVNWNWAFLIVVFGVFASVVGALIPAAAAARARPVRILRYE